MKSLIRILIGALAPGILSADPEVSGNETLKESRPNIILILTDDQGYGELSCYGSKWVKTPHLDRLHSESIRLTNFHVSPTCAPTRAAMMTGRHEFKNGVTHTIFERERMTLDAVTLPQALQQAGYKTGIFGKWHLGDEEAYQPGQRGFDEVFIHGGGGIGQKYPDSCADVPGNGYFNPAINHNGRFVRTKGFCTDVFFRQASGWINEQRKTSDPFFAYISLNAPHSPFHAPKNYTERFLEQGMSKQLAGFYGMIENIDDNVGKLRKHLHDWSMEENTLLIFMTDNGSTVDFIVGNNPEQVGFIHKAGMKGHKNTPQEGGTRVPCFLHWNGKFSEGVDVDRLTAHLDLFPTLAEIAGAELPRDGQVEGRNMLPLLLNPKAPWEERFLFVHCGRWERGGNPNKAKFQNCAIRNERFRLVNNKKLYDIDNDPGQETNVIGQHPELVRAMRAAYDVWWEEVQPLMVNESATYERTHPYIEQFREQKEEGPLPEWSPATLAPN